MILFVADPLSITVALIGQDSHSPVTYYPQLQRQMTSFKDRAAREQCWEVRDAHFKCLDQHQKEQEAPQQCQETYHAMQRLCPKSWVEYFLKKRLLDKAKQEKMSLNSDNDAVVRK